MGTKTGTKYHASTLVQLPAKGNKWYVVVTKPKELQTPRSNKIRRSTGTVDKKIAKGLQHQLTQEIYAEFDAALKPTPPTLDELAERYWQPTLSDSSQNFKELIADSDGGNLFAAMRIFQASKGDPLVADQLFENLEYHEAELFRDYITPKAHEDPYPKNSPRYDGNSKGIHQEGAKSIVSKENYPLSSLIDAYISERKWVREKSKAAAMRHLEMFREIVNIKYIDDIQKKHAYRFAEGLQSKGYANKTIKSAVSSVSAFLTGCEQNEWITSNPFINLKLSDYGNKAISYKPFSKSQLVSLFSRGMKVDDRLCLLLLVATGMRLDEVTLLKYEQIKTHEDGFLFIDLTEALVKNEGSKRYIPIHPAVKIRKISHGRIFDYKLGKDGKAESDASKRLMKIIRSVTDDPQLVVHSLRGTFKDMLREVNVSKETNDFITGHGHGDTGGDYGKGPSIRARYDAIVKINLDFLEAKL